MATPIKLSVMVEKAIQHTETIKELVLRPKRRCPAFKPGQFLHLAIDPYDPSSNWPESRVFSIASAPTRDTLRIIFAVKGAFTTRMFNEIKEGDELFVKLPYGSFTFHVDRPLALIAGGTGITPFLSFLEYCVHNRVETRIALYYGIKTRVNLICNDVLTECARLRNIECTCYLEDGGVVEEADRCRQGIISIEDILAENKAEIKTFYYLSGPLEMIRQFRTYLATSGVPEANIRVDDWE